MGLRRSAFVLRPSRRALRAAPGLPQGLDAVSHGRAFRLRRRSRAALRRNARPYAFAGVVALRSSLTLPRFPGLLRGLLERIPVKYTVFKCDCQEEQVGESTWVQLQYLQYTGWVDKHYLVSSKVREFTTLDCLGTEPFWSLDIKSGKVVLRDMDENETYLIMH